MPRSFLKHAIFDVCKAMTISYKWQKKYEINQEEKEIVIDDSPSHHFYTTVIWKCESSESERKM